MVVIQKDQTAVLLLVVVHGCARDLVAPMYLRVSNCDSITNCAPDVNASDVFVTVGLFVFPTEANGRRCVFCQQTRKKSLPIWKKCPKDK